MSSQGKWGLGQASSDILNTQRLFSNNNNKKMFYDILASTDDKTLYVSSAVMVIVLAGSYVTLFGFGVSGIHSGYRCSLGEMMWLLLTWKSFVRAIFGRGYCTYKRKETLVVRIKISIYYMTPLLASPCIFTNFYFKIHSQVIRVFF